MTDTKTTSIESALNVIRSVSGALSGKYVHAQLSHPVKVCFDLSYSDEQMHELKAYMSEKNMDFIYWEYHEGGYGIDLNYSDKITIIFTQKTE